MGVAGVDTAAFLVTTIVVLLEVRGITDAALTECDIVTEARDTKWLPSIYRGISKDGDAGADLHQRCAITCIDSAEDNSVEPKWGIFFFSFL